LLIWSLAIQYGMDLRRVNNRSPEMSSSRGIPAPFAPPKRRAGEKSKIT
jgi:hypothetical protein